MAKLTKKQLDKEVEELLDQDVENKSSMTAVSKGMKDMASISRRTHPRKPRPNLKGLLSEAGNR